MTHDSRYDHGNDRHGTSTRSGNGSSRRGSADSAGTTSALIAGAAGFGLGLLVLAGRKAAFQAPTFAAGDWFEGLKAEHKAARQLFEALAATGEDDWHKRGALLMELQYAIARHNVQEEYVVYCVLAEHGQAEIAEGLNADHFELKQGLFELETIIKEQGDGWAERLAAVRDAFESHVREEEEDAFPALKAQLSEEQTTTLTKRMNREGFKVA